MYLLQPHAGQLWPIQLLPGSGISVLKPGNKVCPGQYPFFVVQPACRDGLPHLRQLQAAGVHCACQGEGASLHPVGKWPILAPVLNDQHCLACVLSQPLPLAPYFAIRLFTHLHRTGSESRMPQVMAFSNVISTGEPLSYSRMPSQVTYWTIFGVISAAEQLVQSRPPLYYHVKFALLLWLQEPKYQVLDTIFLRNIISPLFAT